jgi:ribonuclease HI
MVEERLDKSGGNKVTNQDLIQEALRLDDQIKRKGSPFYVWIPKEDNRSADKLCNDLMDDMCDEMHSSY